MRRFLVIETKNEQAVAASATIPRKLQKYKCEIPPRNQFKEYAAVAIRKRTRTLTITLGQDL